MNKNDYIENLKKQYIETVKLYEFARKYGIKGEAIESMFAEYKGERVKYFEDKIDKVGIRKVIVDNYRDNFSISEISDMYGICPSVIKSLLVKEKLIIVVDIESNSAIKSAFAELIDTRIKTREHYYDADKLMWESIEKFNKGVISNEIEKIFDGGNGGDGGDGGVSAEILCSGIRVYSKIKRFNREYVNVNELEKLFSREEFERISMILGVKRVDSREINYDFSEFDKKIKDRIVKNKH